MENFALGGKNDSIATDDSYFEEINTTTIIVALDSQKFQTKYHFFHLRNWR